MKRIFLSGKKNITNLQLNIYTQEDSMDTRLLVFFLGIAEVGNMTRAAENLHVTQPTLSKQLNKLEEMLGVELFQ